MKYRQEISPTAPLLVTAVEQRRVPVSELREHDAAVAINIDFDRVLKNIFELFPETKNLAIVIGASEEMYRDYDDRDQAEYIRKWREERNAKRVRKKHR